MARNKFYAVAAAALAAFPLRGVAQDVSGVHPSFQYANIMPANFNPAGLGGLGFIGNDGFIATWGGSQKNAGELWMIPGLATANPGTPVKIDGPLREALGLRIVDGVIYVLTKPELVKYTKQSNGSWTKSRVATGWAFTDSQWHHFAFSLIHHEGSFYFNTGTAYVNGAASPIDENENPQRGSTIKVNPATGTFEALVKGLRNANGLVVGPDNELFATDNQGNWVPANKLMHIKAGRHYGYRTNANYNSGTVISPPAIWLPYGNSGTSPSGNYSNSPTRPFFMTEGTYKGQLIAGDVFHGGLQRYFLEKVGGEYQGACFRFSMGIGYGVNEIVKGPDGNLYTAGIGGGCCGMDGSGNWNYQSKNNGLGRLTPTTTTAFEILAMRSVQGGFELEFTKPASAGAGTASNYTMQSWWYNPTINYGGTPTGTANVTVSSAELSADKRKVKLTVSNPQVNKVYYVKLNNTNITADGGGNLWTNEAWYTQLKLGPGDPPTAVRQAREFIEAGAFNVQPGAMSLPLPFHHPYSVALLDLQGRSVRKASGSEPGAMDLRGVVPGIYWVAGRVGAEPIRKMLRVP